MQVTMIDQDFFQSLTEPKAFPLQPKKTTELLVSNRSPVKRCSSRGYYGTLLDQQNCIS